MARYKIILSAPITRSSEDYLQRSLEIEGEELARWGGSSFPGFIRLGQWDVNPAHIVAIQEVVEETVTFRLVDE